MLKFSDDQGWSEIEAESDEDANSFSSAVEDLPKDTSLRRKERRRQHKDKKMRERIGSLETLEVPILTHENETDEEDATLKAVYVQTIRGSSEEQVTNLDNLSRHTSVASQDEVLLLEEIVSILFFINA